MREARKGNRELFVQQYIATLPDLLATYPFLDDNGDGVFETASAANENTLLLDLKPQPKAIGLASAAAPRAALRKPAGGRASRNAR